MRIIKIFVLILILMFYFQVTANAEELTNEYGEKYYKILSDELSDEAIDILAESGFDEIDFEKILSSSPEDILNFFISCSKGKIATPLKNFVINAGVAIIVSISFSYLSEDEKKKKAVTMLVYAYISLSVCAPMASLLSAGVAAIKMSSNFMLVFLPILAGIIAASNNPLLALNYNSLTMYLAEAVSSFAANFLVPVEGMFFALICVNVVSDTMHIKNFAQTVKNTVVKTLSVLATIFTAVLSIKGILSNIADTVAVKGTKLLVSSVVPIIGGSVSEAYATIVNSLMLLRSSVGVFGIAAIAAVNLPVITELILWSVSMTCSAIVADVFSLKNIADFYREISNVIKTFNAILVFCLVLFIVSTGILITIRNSM